MFGWWKEKKDPCFEAMDAYLRSGYPMSTEQAPLFKTKYAAFLSRALSYTLKASWAFAATQPTLSRCLNFHY